MDTHRFDALTKALATRTQRRGALLAGVVAFIGFGVRYGRPGAAQEGGTPSASPAASPAATPGLFDVLSGTPNVPGALARSAEGCCRALQSYNFVERQTWWVRRRDSTQDCYTEEETSFLSGECNNVDCDYTCRLQCIG